MIILLLAQLASPTRAEAARLTLEGTVASVNQHMVLRSDVAKFRRSLALRQQIDPLYADSGLSEKNDRMRDEDIVAFLIDEKIILQKYPISDAETETEVTTIQGRNKISRDGLVAALAAQGFSYEDYFELIRVATAKRTLLEQEIRARANVSEDDIRNEFFNKRKVSESNKQFNLRIIRTTKKDDILKAAEMLRTGKPFEKVAAEINDDSSAETGGDLGAMTFKDMSPSLRKALVGMKAGDVSGVLSEENRGYFMLKVEDVRLVDETEYQAAREEIRNQLMAKEFRRQIDLWISRNRATSSIHYGIGKNNRN